MFAHFQYGEHEPELVIYYHLRHTAENKVWVGNSDISHSVVLTGAV